MGFELDRNAYSDFHTKLTQIIDTREEVAVESPVCCHDVHSQGEISHSTRGWHTKEGRDFHAALNGQLRAIVSRDQEFIRRPRT